MISEEMIAEAAAKYNEALVSYWRNVEMEEHEFSPQFERKMRKLIWKVKHPYLYPALRSAACLLLVFLISVASVLTFNVEARAAFVSWMKEVWPDSIVYRFFGEKESGELPQYRVTWVPEGYEVVDEYLSKDEYIVVYQKGDDVRDGFILNYFYLRDGDFIEFMTNMDKYDRFDVMVNGNRGEFYEPKDHTDTKNLIWFDTDAQIGFQINSMFEREDMLRIAESVEEKR